MTSTATHTALVTGANRGIGLELVRTLRSRGYAVIGTARDPDDASELKAAASETLRLDHADPESVRALARTLGDRPIDLHINNAGVGDEPGTLDDLDCDALETFFRVNAIGPMRVTQALLPNIRAGSAGEGGTVVNISTIMSSIATTGAGYYGYRASKAALNMLAKLASLDLASDGVMVVNLHPGWVQTRMGGENAAITPKESAEGLVRVIENLTDDMRGGLYDYRGERIPW
ncbi:MAG: SDR family oxidoreductase [Phycisphaeraceae bacterium]|nr:SDR family oxidoreductase [Phycisphaeraceae bacterium]